MISAPREKVCGKCLYYGFRQDNPRGWRWAYCEAKKKWFRENILKPGDRQGCEAWK